MNYHAITLSLINVKTLVTFCIATMLLLYSCNNVSQNGDNDKRVIVAGEGRTDKQITKKTDSLIYESKVFSSYVDATRRGAGVVTFNLEINDRLDIWNMDNTKFGDVVLNEDLTYFTLNMPRKVTARKVIPEYDFAAFDFDAEQVDTDHEYLIIYVNKGKRKVKKAAVAFTFKPW